MTKKTMVLCILDGWGYSEDTHHNSIALAHTPHFDQFLKEYPMTFIHASENEVGLPCGQMGNSEVGHMNIGAGRVVMQDLPRIDLAIQNNEIIHSPEFIQFVDNIKSTPQKRCHIMGLLSDGGVHSHQSHFEYITNLLKQQGIQVFVHAFLDGRDTPPKSAIEYISHFEKATNLQLSTMGGRYYGMDRDNRWDRIQLAFDAIVNAKGPQFSNTMECVNHQYENNVTDEFILPHVSDQYKGIQEGDSLIMINFRSDRARQILHTMVDPQFNHFERSPALPLKNTLGMVEYSSELSKYMPCLFPPTDLKMGLGEVISLQGMKQLRMAETEKYAHVTFFLNGGREEPFENEDRILIPSPKVATYDLKPEMSAFDVTEKLTEAIQSQKYDLIIVNYANADMVGHTGNENAAIQAIESLDQCVGKVAHALKNINGTLIITADHGNAEMMIDPKTHEPHTAHTLNLVPFIIVNAPQGIALKSSGKLADIAPTILDLMGIKKPEQMTGHTLITGEVQ